MKDEEKFWKGKEETKGKKNNYFTFSSFIQALHIIANQGFQNTKDDISVRMPKLFKHIQDVLSRNKSSPGAALKDKLRLIDSGDRNKILNKEPSDLYMMSNRSGISSKSNRAKSKSHSQGRNKKRKTSQRKRGRRYTKERNTPGLLNRSFLTAGINDSKNSLPALSAIYGSSFSKNQYYKRNNSGISSIDWNGKRKKKAFNLEKVNQTLDVKLYDKNNSLTLVGDPKLTKEYTSKKTPSGKRNLSMSNQNTYDGRNSREFKTINPLDFDARMNLIKQSNFARYEGIRNHRYKLQSLINQKKRSGSRRKSSNSK